MKYITHLKAVFLMLTVSLFIAGCGESSSSTSSDLTSSDPTTRTLTFNSNTLSLEVGGAGGTLIASLDPTGTGTVMYASNNTGVATIDRLNGAVTAISAGTAIITASVPADGSLYTAASATATVTVTVTRPTVTLSLNYLRLGVGESASVVVTLDGSTDTAATVVSGGSNIATAVNNNGIIAIEGAAPGQTDVVVTASDGNSTAAVTVVVNNRPTGNAGYHAFVTGYAVSTNTAIFAHTDNGFGVYVFQGNGFANAFSANDAVNINQRLGVGAQFYHASTLSNTAFAGISVQAPQSYDFSSATHLVLQVGNALPTAAHPNAHSTFTARIQNPADQQCNINVPLSPSDTPDTNSQGFLTHTLDLSTGWDCGGVSVADVLATLDEVAVLLLGGTDPDSDASTDTATNHTLLVLGNIGFLGTRAATPNTNDLQLLAHSYATGSTIPDGDIGSNAITNANAGVYLFQSAGITTSWDGATVDANIIQQRQSIGHQWTSTGDLAEGMSFGLTVQAPNRGRLAVSADSALQIQMGNGAGDAEKTHTTYTLRVTGGIQHSSNFSWQHDCQVNVSIAEGRDGTNDHEWRHSHYSIPLADFSTCRAGSLEGIVDAGVSEVIVSVEGGNNPVADVGGGFHTLIQIGWIGFTR